MLKISFYPESDIEDFKQAVSEYENIWNQDGERIIKSWEEHTGLKFRESFINAVIGGTRSHSHPLHFRYNYSANQKKAALIHELGHRILYKLIPGMGRASGLEHHKLLDLVLGDVIKDVYGDDLLKETIEWEGSRLDKLYKEAWDWALSFNPEERKDRFKKILSGDLTLLNT